MKKRIDDLGINNLKILQNPEYFCFGIDAVLLSDFAKKIKNGSNVLDIGTGNGIIPLLLSAKCICKKITGLEIQNKLYNLAKENVTFNNLDNLITIINGDIKNVENIFSENSFDVVITNPPYKKKDSGIVNDNEFIKIAKHETLCTLEDIIKQSKYLLNDKGKFYMVHRPDRLVDIMHLMRKYKIEPKELRYVHSKIAQAPVLILIKGVINAKPFLKTLPPLIIYNQNGEYTEEINRIYGKDINYEKW